MFKLIILFIGFISIFTGFHYNYQKPEQYLPQEEKGIFLYSRESFEIPLSGIEVSIKLKTGKNYIKRITDTEGKCIFDSLAKAEYLLYIFNYNSTAIDSILKMKSISKKEIKNFIFKIKIYMNECLAQFDIIEKTPSQLSQKSGNGLVANELVNNKDIGHIDVSIMLEISGTFKNKVEPI